MKEVDQFIIVDTMEGFTMDLLLTNIRVGLNL